MSPTVTLRAVLGDVLLPARVEKPRPIRRIAAASTLSRENPRPSPGSRRRTPARGRVFTVPLFAPKVMYAMWCMTWQLHRHVQRLQYDA